MLFFESTQMLGCLLICWDRPKQMSKERKKKNMRRKMFPS